MSSKKITEEEFYIRAFNKHGYKYDYTNVKYINTTVKICIICHEKDENGIEHGEFWQTPGNHFKKGCLKCGIITSANAKKINIKDTINKANIIHNYKYDYSNLQEKKIHEINTVICPEHGEFKQSMNNHINNKQGCPECAQLSRNIKMSYDTEKFIEVANKKFNYKYDYSKVNYTNNKTKITIICEIHGEFKQTPMSHLANNGCPLCGNESGGLKNRKSKNDFIEKANVIHNYKYDYSKVNFNTRRDETLIICPIHGEFIQKPIIHLTGSGCPMCGLDKISKAKLKTNEEFIEQANKIHNYKYDYLKTTYISATEHVEIICNDHGSFFKSPDNHLAKKQGCPKCSSIGSKQESFIKDILDEYNVIYKNNDRKMLNGKELDVFIPNKNIAIELNGIYWHNEKFVENNYHLEKLNNCIDNKIKLLQFFEDEVNDKPNIVKSMVINVIGETKNKIYGRKCVIKELTYKESKYFLNENHIQGNCMSLIRYGLFYNNELVSIMTFGRLRNNLGNKIKKEGEYELLRFCNKLNTTVIGGASKLLKHFINNNSVLSIISYCDRRISDGELYNKLGFSFIQNSKPNYFYTSKNKRVNRYNYRKDILVKEGFDSNKTEKEIMKERGIYRIYDCGTKLFKLVL